MRNKQNINVGDRYGLLTVNKRVESGKNRMPRWLCSCECGNKTIVFGSNLLRGRTRSCGCLQKQQATIHGQHNTRLYHIWDSMIQRCTNVKASNYQRYGGRCVHVCNEWKNFECFYDWAISNGYSDSLTIDRIDVNGNYEPSNCRWVTNKEQSRNRRNNRMVTYNGKMQTLVEWSEEIGINYGTLSNRVNTYGWSIEKAFTTPVKGRN